MDSCVLIASALAFGLYINTLPAEFAYDDSRAIVKNPDLSSDTPLLNIFYNDFWGTPLVHSGSHKSYRPLCVLTFRLNHLLGGLDPLGYHLGNVLLHAVVTGLFTYTVQTVTQSTLVAWFAGLLFASHPIHTEAVAGVVGRADVLAGMFVLLAILSYRRYTQQRDSPSHTDCANFTKTKWALGAALATAAAMLSKEQGVTVLAVCAVYDVFVHCRLNVRQLLQIHKAAHRGLREGLLFLASTGILLISFRVYFMGNKPPEFAPADNPASDSDSLLTRTLTYNYLPFLNLWLLLYPRTLSFDWSMEAVPLIESLTDPRNCCTFTFYAFLSYTAYYVIQELSHHSEHVDSTSSNSKEHHHSNHSNGVVANGNGHYSYSEHRTLSNGCNGYNNTHISATDQIVPTSLLSNGHHNGNHHNGGARSHSNGKNHNGVRHRGNRVRRNSNSSTDSSHSDDSHLSSVGLQRTLAPVHVLVLSLALLIFPFIPATNLFFYVGFVIAERVLYIPSMGFCLLVAQGMAIMWQRCREDKCRQFVLKAVIASLLVGYSVRTVVRNRDWLTEENLYRAGIAVNPAKAWGNLANILNNKGHSAAAEDAYKAALLQRGNMADVHYNLGILLQEQKRWSEAVTSYKMAIQCRPRLTMAHLNLAIVYTSLGKKDEAEEIYRHCAEIDITGLKDPRLHEQTKISALYNLGRLLADQERFNEAVDVYREAIARRPAHYAPQSLYNMLGEAYSKLDQLEEAEMWYKRALAAKPDHIPAHLTMGKLAHRRGDLAGAEDWFLRARALDPADGSVHQHYGQFLGEIGRHREAADYYTNAATLAPDDFELVFNAANALRQSGKELEAEEYYRKAVKLSPQMATAHMNLGAMLHYNGKLEEAERSYLMALALKPDDSITQANLKKLRNLLHKHSAPGGGKKR